jgi:hypothetical protein
MAYHGKKLTELKGDARAARIKQLLSNPGTRKLVPEADLPSSYRAQRQLNTRLNAPIVAGSSTTNRDLAHQREAAVTTQFGPNAVGAQQFRETQTNAWFDEYQRQLAQHRANVQGFGEQAQGQIANLGNVTGPAGSAPQDAGNQDVAGKAAAIRGALLGAQKGQLAGQGAAANTYADTLANVVAPGAKVQALSQAAGATDALKQKIGAFKTQFEGDAKTSEGKNVLAAQALGLNTAKATSQIAATDTKTKKTAADIAYFNKHGYYPRTGPAPKPKAPDTGKVNQYGYTDADWRAMSTAARQKVIKDFKAGKGTKPADPATQNAKDFYNKYGVKPAATAAVANAQGAVSTASSYVTELKKAGWSRQQIGQALLQGIAPDKKAKQKGYPKQKALWLTVALDQAFNNGLITAGTANKLHHAGYSVKTLGLSTGAPKGSSTYVKPPKASVTGSQGDSSGR